MIYDLLPLLKVINGWLGEGALHLIVDFETVEAEVLKDETE